MVNPKADHFYTNPNWRPGVTFCGDRMLSRIDKGAQFETDVTRVLSFFTGEFGVTIAQIFLQLGGVEDSGRPADTWVGREWLTATGTRRKGDTRLPDIIVTDLDDEQAVRLIIEVKGNASVNGHSQYCAVHSHEHGYANQIICYASSCWTTADLRGVPRLIRGPRRHQSAFGGWGRTGLVERDGEDPHYAKAFAAQQEALSRWRSASLEDLRDRIKGLEPSPAQSDASKVLGVWMRRIGL